jgi:hypothetical protein
MDLAVSIAQDVFEVHMARGPLEQVNLSAGKADLTRFPFF